MQTKLIVKGMHCGACKKLIESEIADLEGVTTISIDLASENASIEHNDQQINPQTLIEKITELGYQASLNSAQ